MRHIVERRAFIEFPAPVAILVGGMNVSVTVTSRAPSIHRSPSRVIVQWRNVHAAATLRCGEGSLVLDAALFGRQKCAAPGASR